MQTQENRDVITGKEGGPIELETATKWTGYYRQRNPDETISHFFGNEILNQILNQPGCMGLRIYYSNSERPGIIKRLFIALSNFFRKSIINTVGVKHLIVVGVNKDGTDQLPSPITKQPDKIQPVAMVSFSASSGNTAADQSMPCPGAPGCPKNKLTE